MVFCVSICEGMKAVPRSKDNCAMLTRQPLFRPPTTFFNGIRTSS